jgi:hypothetical protein
VRLTVQLDALDSGDKIVIGVDDLMNGRDLFGGYKIPAKELTISVV